MLRNRIIFFVLFVVISTVTYYYANFFTALIFYAFVFLLLFSLIHLFICFKAIKIKQEINPQIVEHGQTITYTFTLYNETPLPFPFVKLFFLNDTVIFKETLLPMEFHLFPNDRFHFSCDLSCHYRGIYSVGIAKLQMSDFLNIFSFTQRLIESKQLIVFPKITPLPNFHLMPKAHGEFQSSTHRSLEPPNAFIDVRDFQQGDALKRIHWKLSAHQNKLLVKNLEQSTQNHTVLFLDTLKGLRDFTSNIIIEDKLMETFVSIAQQCLLKNHLLEVAYYRFDYIHHIYTAWNDFDELFNTAASILFSQSVPVHSVIETYLAATGSTQMLYGRDVFIFTNHQDSIEKDSLINELLSRQCHVYIITCTRSNIKSSVYTDTRGVHYYSMTPATNVEAILEGDYHVNIND